MNPSEIRARSTCIVVSASQAPVGSSKSKIIDPGLFFTVDDLELEINKVD